MINPLCEAVRERERERIYLVKHESSQSNSMQTQLELSLLESAKLHKTSRFKKAPLLEFGGGFLTRTVQVVCGHGGVGQSIATRA